MLSLIEKYCRLLTSDSGACAELFSDDAHYITAVQSKPIHLTGRQAIHDFIRQAPRHLTFTVTDYRETGSKCVATVQIHGPQFTPTAQTIKFTVSTENGGLFSRFEVIHPPVGSS